MPVTRPWALGYEKGLINYTTEHRLEGHSTRWCVLNYWSYGAILVLMLGLFFVPNRVSTLQAWAFCVIETNCSRVNTLRGWLKTPIPSRWSAHGAQQEQEYKLDVSGLPGSIWYGKQTVTVARGGFWTYLSRFRCRSWKTELTSFRQFSLYFLGQWRVYDGNRKPLYQETLILLITRLVQHPINGKRLSNEPFYYMTMQAFNFDNLTPRLHVVRTGKHWGSCWIWASCS